MEKEALMERIKDILDKIPEDYVAEEDANQTLEYVRDKLSCLRWDLENDPDKK